MNSRWFFISAGVFLAMFFIALYFLVSGSQESVSVGVSILSWSVVPGGYVALSGLWGFYKAHESDIEGDEPN